MAKLTCKLFGHKPMKSGWWGDVPYMKIEQRGIDNIGRIHGAAYHKCDRCGTRYLAGRLHINDPVIVAALQDGQASAIPPAF